MNFSNTDWRQRRNLLNEGIPFHPMHFKLSSYSTDATVDMKTSMNDLGERIAEGNLLNRLHSIPDPLRKNLADTIYTTEDLSARNRKMSLENEQFRYQNTMRTESPNQEKTPTSSTIPSLAGITGFFSHFFGAISGVMFHKRPKSPVSQYYDCFDYSGEMQGAPPGWQPAKTDDQNKTCQSGEQFSSGNDSMNNCKSAVVHCEDKLNAVRNLLTNKTGPSTPKWRPRCPRRVFVQPGSVDENFEDAISNEDFVSLANDDYIKYVSVSSNHSDALSEVESPKIKCDIATDKSEVKQVPKTVDSKPEDSISPPIVPEKDIITKMPDTTEVVKNLTQAATVEKSTSVNVDGSKALLNTNIDPSVIVDLDSDNKTVNKEVISSCEDKMARLKMWLQEKRMRTCNSKIDTNESGPESEEDTTKKQHNEGKEYFDEVKGRFHSTSTTDSEDSFQIVFSDSPKQSRMRKPSDCDSEDSFIVFEETPDDCYTTNDVFGAESTDESDAEDSDSDASDSEISGCKLSHSFSKTYGDLTDDSLYEEDGRASDVGCDELDCAVRTMCDVIPSDVLEMCNGEENETEEDGSKRGLLLNEARKLRKRDEPPKKVTFSEQPPKVHVLRVWAFAARQARAGHWESHARDRDRFRRRIADVDMAISWVLKPQHRSRVMFQRIMPWRNAQKRQEIAERKIRQEEERKRQELEKMKLEEKNDLGNNLDGSSTEDGTDSNNVMERLAQDSEAQETDSALADVDNSETGTDSIFNNDVEVMNGNNDFINDDVKGAKDLKKRGKFNGETKDSKGKFKNVEVNTMNTDKQAYNHIGMGVHIKETLPGT